MNTSGPEDLDIPRVVVEEADVRFQVSVKIKVMGIT
jgi:hypothetical protein